MIGKLAGSCLLIATLIVVGGCTPRVDVRPNPGPHAKGIRYYRPKPYLFITPFTETVTVGAGEKAEVAVTGMTDQYVQMELQMLPDFSEEYAINIRTGFGSNETEITLEDGWNLTSLNTKLDSQTDENIKAVADLITSVGSVASAAATADQSQRPQKPVVRATNVPLGYYESVIGRDRCGRKQLYGWRYVGFAPFNGCPMHMCGSESLPCDAIELYGLAFDNGIMTFKRIHTLETTGQEDNCLIDEEARKCSPQPKPEVIRKGIRLIE